MKSDHETVLRLFDCLLNDFLDGIQREGCNYRMASAVMEFFTERMLAQHGWTTKEFDAKLCGRFERRP